MTISSTELTIKSQFFPELIFPYPNIIEIYTSVAYEKRKSNPLVKDKKEYIHIMVTEESVIDKQLPWSKLERLVRNYREKENTYKFQIEMVRNHPDEILNYIELYIPQKIKKQEIHKMAK